MKDLLFIILYTTLGCLVGASLSALVLMILKQLVPSLGDLLDKLIKKTPRTKVFRGALFIGILFIASMVKDFFNTGYFGYGLTIGLFIYLKDVIFDSSNKAMNL